MIEKQKLTAYFDFCHYQKNLNWKSIKAYKIDLEQFFNYLETQQIVLIDRNAIENFIAHLSKKYKPTSVRRKYVAVKSFYSYLNYTEFLKENPFDKIKLRLQEERLLPKTFPLNLLELILQTAYEQLQEVPVSSFQHFRHIQIVAVLELLFCTGLRVSELCDLTLINIDLDNQQLLIKGKGSKERVIYISSDEVISTLKTYVIIRSKQKFTSQYFFVNRFGNRLSEQSVRTIINNVVTQTKIPYHITPHMFRHSLATTLLDEGVDCRHIQHILGHSSIRTTELYTHVSLTMQKTVLLNKHPRNNLSLQF